MGGGGSASGAVSYPDYMQCVHHAWLQTVDVTRADLAGKSPYKTSGDNWFDYPDVLPDARGMFGFGTAGEDSFDTTPRDILEAAVTFGDTMPIDVDSEIITYFNGIKAALEANPVDPQYIQDLLDSVGAGLAAAMASDKYPALEQIGRFEQESINAGAVLSSTFIYARNSIMYRVDEQQQKAVLAQLSALADKIALQQANQIFTGALDSAIKGVNMAVQEQANELSYWNSIVRSTFDGTRILFEEALSQAESGVEVAAKDRLWEMQIWETPLDVMACIAGAATPKKPDGPSKSQKAVAGMAAGAAAGAQVGAGNPYAIAAGAVIGGIAGLLA